MEPSEELSWMQGQTGRERDVDIDKAMTIATDGLKDERKFLVLS